MLVGLEVGDEVLQGVGHHLGGTALVVERFGVGGRRGGGPFAAPTHAPEVLALFVEALTEGGEGVGDLAVGGDDGLEAGPEGVAPWNVVVISTTDYK